MLQFVKALKFRTFVLVALTATLSMASCTSTTPGNYFVPGKRFIGSFGVGLVMLSGDSMSVPPYFPKFAIAPSVNVDLRWGLSNQAACGIAYSGIPSIADKFTPYFLTSVPLNQKVSILPQIGFPFSWHPKKDGAGEREYTQYFSAGLNITNTLQNDSYISIGLKFDPLLNPTSFSDTIDFSNISQYGANLSYGVPSGNRLYINQVQWSPPNGAQYDFSIVSWGD